MQAPAAKARQGVAGPSGYELRNDEVSVRLWAQAMRKLILRNFQSPGDIVMLTAAVRDLHKCHPNQFVTDVRTSAPQLWANNLYITPLSERDSGVETIQCHYPLIHHSNTGPWHFIHGFIQFLSDQLKVPIRPTAFKGDIHLATVEKQWMSQVQEITREPVPFWIVVAGGKRDFTIKWWDHARFQAVVNHFQGKVLFVQVGEKSHEHPPLKGVLDLRGKTDLRQLVRLVYHAQGVLCPVTLLMHLAAAVEIKPGTFKNRPCVVIAGGREPSQWEAYPSHQFVHTNGALLCCDNGGCWKSRTVPLEDGDQKDKPEGLCVDVVNKRSSKRETQAEYLSCANDADSSAKINALAYPKEKWGELLPRCMDLITAEEIVRRVQLYFDGRVARYLTREQTEVVRMSIPGLGWKARVP